MDKKVFMGRVFKDSVYYLTSGYGYRIHPITGVKTFHYGEDYGTNRLKVPLYSPVYGIVTESTYSAIRGHYVTVRTVYGYVRMQHLDSRAVAVGKVVTPGMKLGVCGRSGSSTAIHLHIEYKHLDKTKCDPDDFVPRYFDPKKVAVKDLNVRSTPQVKAGNIIDQIHLGDRVDIYGFATDAGGRKWVNNSPDPAKPGWVADQYLEAFNA